MALVHSLTDAQLLTNASLQLAKQAAHHADSYILLKHMLSYFEAKGQLTNQQRTWLTRLTGTGNGTAPGLPD